MFVCGSQRRLCLSGTEHKFSYLLSEIHSEVCNAKCSVSLQTFIVSSANLSKFLLTIAAFMLDITVGTMCSARCRNSSLVSTLRCIASVLPICFLAALTYPHRHLQHLLTELRQPCTLPHALRIKACHSKLLKPDKMKKFLKQLVTVSVLSCCADVTYPTWLYFQTLVNYNAWWPTWLPTYYNALVFHCAPASMTTSTHFCCFSCLLHLPCGTHCV